jgi:hypothetical protein
MGKRTDKGKDKSSALDDDSNKPSVDSLQPYTCTGHFQSDYTELCRRHEPPIDYIPTVVLRPHRPRTPTPLPVIEEKAPKGSRSTKKEEKNQPPPEPEIETLTVLESGEAPEPPPKTYSTKDRFEYFRPCIQVEMEFSEKQETVTEIHIRGWKIDETMMDIFQQCWITMNKLHTINLWSVGLTDTTLELLASFLPNCQNVRTLILDNNPVKNEAWHLLMKDESLIQHLSLRYNCITDVGAEMIGLALGTITRQNQKLLSLNLTGNKIADKGAHCIANGLRLNRCLIALSLANNCIGDEGARYFAEVISRFMLSHEEVVARRKLLSVTSDQKLRRSASPGSKRERAESRDRPGSVRSNTTPAQNASMGKGKGAKTKKLTKEEDTKHEKTKGKAKEPEKPTKKASVLQESKLITKKMEKVTKGKKATAQAEPEAVDSTESVNPLMEPVEVLNDGTVLMKGNMALVSLNLAGNEIGNFGADAFLQALKYQMTMSQFASQVKMPATGLLRLSLQRNKLSKDGGSMLLISALMANRDPLQKGMSNSRADSELSF